VCVCVCVCVRVCVHVCVCTGTPGFMSPELETGKPYNAKCDVYALGATLYEMLTLRSSYHDKVCCVCVCVCVCMCVYVCVCVCVCEIKPLCVCVCIQIH